MEWIFLPQPDYTYFDPWIFDKRVLIDSGRHMNCTPRFHCTNLFRTLIHMGCMALLAEEHNLHSSSADFVCTQLKNQMDHRRMIRLAFENYTSNIV